MVVCRRGPAPEPDAGGGSGEHDEHEQRDPSGAVAAPPAPWRDRRQNVQSHDPMLSRSSAGLQQPTPRMAAVRTTAELREGFQAFFEEKGHLRLPVRVR